MVDHAALGALPAGHWIHKALAKTKKGGAKKPAMAAMPAKKPAMPMQDDPGDHEYR